MSYYSNGYAVAIVHNDRVVETRKDGVVTLPFGAEYTIRLVNRNQQRALAVISIDGKNVSGGGFVVPAYGIANISRSSDRPVNFRLVSVDSGAAIAQGKGGPDTDGSKGLISVEWRPEKREQPNFVELANHSLHWGTHLQRRTTKKDSAVLSCFEPQENKMLPAVTVDGSFSTQQFKSTGFDIDYTVNPTITTLKLMGYNKAEGIPANGTNFCPACRTKTVSNTDRFCRSCGEKF